ncbi:reverse transcriptase, putative [Talaromyces stipitatus ATCC 10500]|uniref:Reverse transcriptase, putative n=1 Tax=Talaromyces stipitatus (strain ATCC 10500 / CBS 375.48 / QM 6759 / NRRL 1006) TaxID=441959 RepID=B8M474_TALSN|nr:reverse transcriptase, putative [Talaromyces stipitatus ATCC 10500]EED20817.1 reverse transcriptase, putative [Talaromyces stipitatus ATCC 10500]
MPQQTPSEQAKPRKLLQPYQRWQPSLHRSPTPSAEPFINWLDLQGLVLISNIDCPIHERGNVLDLSFASSPLALAGAKTSIASHLDATSDHQPLITTVPWDQRYKETAQKLRFDTLDHTSFLSLLASNLAGTESSAATEEDLDDNHGLCSKTDFCRITRWSQRQFWQDKLSTVTQMKDVFDMSKWHKSTGTFRSPPLKDPLRPNSFLAVTIHEKRDVLVCNLLQNLAEAGDIPLDSPAVPTTSLYFPDIIMAQVEESVLQAGNTAPGSDEIPICILKVAWPLIKDKKLKKTDWSSPSSYRLITLLSVLGKGLERLVARNMAWISIYYKVLARQQFRALLLRSANDLTICLTHDVEQALNQGMTASLLTLDVKGAFDAVLPGRLIRRLREQGWPTNLVLWIASFATGRSVQIRLDGEIGPSTDIACGLPQGSPVSSILFMLYIAPLFCLGNPRNRFGYADDAANLAISTSLATNCKALSDSL